MPVRPLNRRGTADISATVVAWGAAHATVDEMPRLRKALPTWAPIDIPGHFLKYADEQTLVAVQAVDRAARSWPSLLAGTRDRGIVVAARYPGRRAAAHTLARFDREGSPSVSPHIVPQYSLHSVSGALSILLGLRGPNVGVGGGLNALQDGLLSAMTLFDARTTCNWWLVVTGWDPEPVPGDDKPSSRAATCFAVAFALSASAATGCGRLTLVQQPVFARSSKTPNDPAALARGLLAAETQGCGVDYQWELKAGGALELAVECAASVLPAAA